MRVRVSCWVDQRYTIVRRAERSGNLCEMNHERLLTHRALLAVLVMVATPFALGSRPQDARPANESQIARTRVILVRHADRDGKADALTPAGIARTNELIHVLEKSAIDVVYHSDRARTKATALPLCEARGITPIEKPAADVAAVVADVRARHLGKTVLIVGHSNTVPEFASAFGGPAFAIAEDEFDDLVILEFGGTADQPATCLRLQYGAPSP
jgi:phosphohistidine phosphatase SixA